MRTENQLQHLKQCLFITSMVVAIACVVPATGCSRIGANNSLTNRRVPFPQPLRGQSSQPPAATAYTDGGSDSRNYVSQPRTEVSPARDQVQNLKSRPPKLAEMPKATLYAEPVIDNAAQVAFDEKISEFNPAAEPPAQIFSQPVAKPVKATSPQATKAQLAGSTFAREGFVMPRQIEPLRNFIVADPSPQSQDQVTIPSNEVRASGSERILLVTDGSSSRASEEPKQEVKEFVTQVSGVEPLRAKAVAEPKIEPIVEPKIAAFNVAPLLPANPIVVKEAPVLKTENSPVVDPSLAGEIYHQSKPVQIETRVSPNLLDVLDEIDPVQPLITVDPQLAKNQVTAFAEKAPAVPATISEPSVEELSQSIVPYDFSPNFASAPRNPEASSDLPAGITIDPTLEQQRKSRLNYPKRPVAKQAAKPEPKPEPEPKLAIEEIVTTPAVQINHRKPKPVESRVASIKQPDFRPAPIKREFIPLKKCIACDNPDCQGCNIPSDSQFSGIAPAIHGGRSLAPMAVEPAVGGGGQITKKNFGQVSFSSTDLPLPATNENLAAEAEDIAAAFNMSLTNNVPVNAGAGQSDVPPVGVDAVMKINAVTWRSRLQQTIALVEEQLSGDIDSETRTSLEINLRLLDVLSRQMGDIAQEDRQFGESENHYWQHQLDAITSMLKPSGLTDARDQNLQQHRTAHETLAHLRQAVAHLESLANLRIAAGAFCTEVSGYGKFKLFPMAVFKPSQKVLVYCEVENYSSEEKSTESGETFHTRLRGSYAIYDSAGYAVQQAEFPVVEDIARRRRRDFYMHLPITVGDLASGEYELHLLVEDLGGNKTASLTPPLKFSVVTGAPQELQARSSEGSFIR